MNKKHIMIGSLLCLVSSGLNARHHDRKQHAEDVKTDARNLKEDAKALGHSVKEDVKDRAVALGEKAKDAAQSVRDGAQRLGSNVAEKAQDLKERAKTTAASFKDGAKEYARYIREKFQGTPVDYEETPNAVVIKIALPGFDKNTIAVDPSSHAQLSYDDNKEVLSIIIPKKTA